MSGPSATARSEILVSLVLIASGDVKSDTLAIKAATAHAQERFAYFEILLIAAAPRVGWLEKLRAASVEMPNVNIIIFDERRHYDELAFYALSLSIGDVIMADEAAEWTAERFDALFSACVTDGNDIAKSVYGGRMPLRFGRLVISLVRWGLYSFLGRSIETNVLRPFGLTRAAAARIVENGDAWRYFRLLSLDDQFQQARVPLVAGTSPRQLDGFARKTQIAAFLVSASATRILAGIAIFAFLICLISLCYTFYAALTWVFRNDVSEGWTSLSMVLSVLFSANFGILAAVAAGLLKILRNKQDSGPPANAQIISNTDMFALASNLNVEISDDK